MLPGAFFFCPEFCKGEVCKYEAVNELDGLLQIAHRIERYVDDGLLFLIWQ